jgi:hypothetical protein
MRAGKAGQVSWAVFEWARAGELRNRSQKKR